MTRRTDAEIGERIQAMRTERAWSRMHLAEAIGLPVGDLRSIEKGRTTLNEREGLLLAAALGFTLGHLLYEPERTRMFGMARAHRGASDDHVSL
ncbi:MAG: hypothetical protein ABI432_06875 [Flavobacteriales bacterium]